jgi:two-component system sensor histidine kinase/response regulator
MPETKTILVAEDNPGVSDLISILLEDAGYTVETVFNGDEVFDRAKTVQPDLILLDVMMPGKEGWEVAAELLDAPETSKIPIIFLTARAKPDEQLRGWEMPIFDYITKPFTSAELLTKVDQVISTSPEDQSELRNQLRNSRLRQILGLRAE